MHFANYPRKPRGGPPDLDEVFEIRYIPTQSIPRAIDDLLAKGFIEIKHAGGAGEHDMTVYALIEDYLKWKRDVVFRITAAERAQATNNLANVQHKRIALERQAYNIDGTRNSSDPLSALLDEVAKHKTPLVRMDD